MKTKDCRIFAAIRAGIALAVLLACRIPSSANTQSALPKSSDGLYDILDYGAVGDGRTDSTYAIQKAIDAASVNGGIVLIPVGHFLCKGHLEVKPGVHLKGMNEAPQSWEPQTGSILMPTEGRDNEDGSAFIEMRSSTSLSGVTIYYPDQNIDDIRPYPWTIQIRANRSHPHEVTFDTTIADVTLINSYNGIRTGPTENGRHRIMGVHGCVLRRGILVDWTGDIGRLENIQFHCHFWGSKAFHGDFDKAFAYMQHNLEAFVFGRTDWEYVTNTFVFPAKIGYHFIQTANGAANGQFSGIGADATENAVMVEAIQPMGLLITNGEFNSHMVGSSTQVIVEKQVRGNVRFVNGGFWGPVKHNAVLRGEGFTSFSDCYFSNDNNTDEAAILVEAGKVQIQNSTFGAVSMRHVPGHSALGEGDRFQSPSIHLAPGVQSAIIRGNNGSFGVKIENEIGSRAIISDNEPFQMPAPSAEPHP
ncbi:MAG TPA: glycosyl hydrolase family 28-related protein [Candidatus Sulfotelmatobacter sp.]|nr:glycosyl hydrolase family 28-related protein [Candidatus Sulfotelmatobacter sp.]